MKKSNQIFEQCLEDMPNEFSSTYFLKVCRENGISDYEIKLEHHFQFLLSNCDRIAMRTWRKTELKTSKLVLFPETKQLAMNDDDMIKHLKSLGYKILKPTFTEL